MLKYRLHNENMNIISNKQNVFYDFLKVPTGYLKTLINHRNLPNLLNPEFGNNLYREYLLQNYRFENENTRDAKKMQHVLVPIVVRCIHWKLQKASLSPAVPCILNAELYAERVETSIGDTGSNHYIEKLTEQIHYSKLLKE